VIEAQSILSRTGAPEELTRATLSILNNLGAAGRPDNSVNFKSVFDAIRIADLTEALKTRQPRDGGNAACDEPLLTQTGEKIRQQVLDESAVRP
jgi:hypothetical protein